jgi:CubicO group peptidase (beta-lactamase class C family)
MDFSRLTEYLDSLPGSGDPCVDMVVYKDRKCVYRHSAGFRDAEKTEPLRGDELYHIYSVSKVITCAAALTLYERGRFLLSDPVHEYLSAFRDMRVVTIRPDGTRQEEKAKNPITLRHLFTMTSGLDYDKESPELVRAVEDSGKTAPTLAIASAIAARPLQFEPGEHFLYGFSHDVLAAVVEVISGERFSRYVRKAIFEPCGMERSFFHLPRGMEGQMADQYRYDAKRRAAVPAGNENASIFGPDYDSGGAGVICTVEDYARFAEALCHGGVARTGARILSGRTINLMRANHLGPVQMQDMQWPHMRGYGYGLGVRTMVDTCLSGSNGPVGEFGWDGAAGAYALIDPQNGLSAFCARHMLGGHDPFVQLRIRNILYACLK